MILIWEQYSEFPKVNKISITKNQITDTGLKALAENGSKFKNLKEINLGNNQITDQGLKDLA